MAKFPGVDYLLIDSQFSEQELMVRQTARQFVDERVLPLIRDCFRDGRFPDGTDPGDGAARIFRRQPGRLRLRGHEQRRVRAGHAGAGARRLRLRSFVCVQGALVMYPIYTYGSEEQKQQWLPRLQIGRGDRLFRADRAGVRIESGGHADHGAAATGRLGAERREDVDHQRVDRRRGRGVGARRGRDSRIPGGDAARRDSRRAKCTANCRCARR